MLSGRVSAICIGGGGGNWEVMSLRTSLSRNSMINGFHKYKARYTMDKKHIYYPRLKASQPFDSNPPPPPITTTNQPHLVPNKPDGLDVLAEVFPDGVFSDVQREVAEEHRLFVVNCGSDGVCKE